MATLPPEKKKQCQEVFDFYDKDMDGQLTKEDFGDAMKSLGIFIPKDEMNAILDKMPTRDYEHFEGIAANKLSQKVNKDEIIQAFKFLDKDGIGKIPSHELKHALLTLGEPLKENEVNELLKEFTDNDGNVDYKKLIVALVGK